MFSAAYERIHRDLLHISCTSNFRFSSPAAASSAIAFVASYLCHRIYAIEDTAGEVLARFLTPSTG